MFKSNHVVCDWCSFNNKGLFSLFLLLEQISCLLIIIVNDHDLTDISTLFYLKQMKKVHTYIHTYILIVFWDKSTVITKNTNYNKKYKKTEVISICLFSCCFVVLFVLFLLLPLLLLLWQYKRLDAQSKKKKLWLGGKP